MHKVFLMENKFFAQIFYIYLSENGTLNSKILYPQFLERMMPVWPKAGVVMGQNLDELTLKRQRAKRLLEMAYNMYNFSRNDQISIIDIQEMCAHFGKDTPLGDEVHQMLEIYTAKNLRLKNAGRYQVKFDYPTFVETFPKSNLVTCLDRLFNH